MKPHFYPVFIKKNKTNVSIPTDTVYRTGRFVWCWSVACWVGPNDIIQGADRLYEYTPVQEVPRSFQMIGVDTELRR